MSGYFDEQAGASAAGFSHGHIQGTHEGLRQGRAQGFDAGQQDGYSVGHAEGHRVGYDTGWNDCLAAANVQMLKQMEFTRQHIADKEQLNKQLDDHRRTIGNLTERLDTMEKDCASLKTRDQNFCDVVTALRTAHDRLIGEISQWEKKFKTRTEEYADQVRKYNRSMVFMNAVRAVLEDLTGKPGGQARLVRELFVKRYTEEVDVALKDGAIHQTLEQDEAFGRSLPKTQKFIVRLLSAAPSDDRHNTAINSPVDF